MRHRKSGRHLSRFSGHRRALLRNLVISLIQHEMIKTSLEKAKELRRFAEPLITLSKTDTVANRRLAFSRIRNRNTVQKLFLDVGPRSQNRLGGYLRILKSGFRQGDSTTVAIVELVDRVQKTED